MLKNVAQLRLFSILAFNAHNQKVLSPRILNKLSYGVIFQNDRLK